MPFFLTSGKNQRWVRVDQDDYDLLTQHKWNLLPNGYVQRTVKGSSVYLHRVLMGLDKGNRLQVDHINGNALDNRRSNLRVVTHAQNQQNQLAKRGTSRYRGVYRRTDGRWQTQIEVDGKVHRLGIFDDEDEAGARVMKHRLDFHPFAVLDRCVA